MTSKHETIEEAFNRLINGFYKGLPPFRIENDCGLSRGVIARIKLGELPPTYSVVESLCTGAGQKLSVTRTNRPKAEVEAAKKALFERLAIKKANRKPNGTLIKGSK